MMEIAAHQGQQCILGIEPAAVSEWLTNGEAILWIDIMAPTPEDVATLQQEFHFHPLALEDIRERHQRPKVDLYESYAFMVFYAVHIETEGNRLKTDEVRLFVGRNYIITLHDLPISELREMRQRWERNATRLGSDSTTLLYSILDTIMDGYFPALDWVAEQLDTIEDCIFDEFDPEILKDTLALKRALLALRRVAGPQRDVINVLLRGEDHILPEQAQLYLQDLYDHSLRVVETLDSYREMVMGVTDVFLSVQSNVVNEIMKRLTVINLLFLPLAVLTGFFGMNFGLLPYDSPVAFALALLMMVALPTSLWMWLHRAGWE